MFPKPQTPADLISMHLEIEFKKLYERGWNDGCSALIDQSVKVLETTAETVHIDRKSDLHIIEIMDDRN